jgi:ABC-type transport system involved in cytochrome bd biosynthesis fused ATPase/permease subunit
VVFTSSPLLLDRADRVALVHEGEVVAIGVHRELVDSEPRYRAVVTRETDEEPVTADEGALVGARQELEEIEERA